MVAKRFRKVCVRHVLKARWKFNSELFSLEAGSPKIPNIHLSSHNAPSKAQNRDDRS